MPGVSGQRVVLTGGTDGIGLILSRMMTEHGAELLIVGRKGNDAAKAGLVPGQNYVCADLSQPDGPARVAQAITDLGWQEIDVLIHNAAAGWVGPIEAQPVTSVDELISTNLLSPIVLSRLLLPQLRQARGRIVFVGSASVDRPCPSFAVYGATKAALSGFARSLRSELIGEVKVQVIHPGPTRTAFHAKSGLRSPWASHFFMSPETVAESIFFQLGGNQAVSTVGYTARLARWFRAAGEAR